MANDKAWDDFLFEKFKLVAVDPWTTEQDLGLLIVYTKRGSYGILPWNRGPKWGRSGAMKNLTNESEISASAHENKLEELLSACKSSSHPAMVTTLQSSNRISAAILATVMGDHSNDKRFYVKVDNVKSESIDQDRLASLINEGNWKPDINSPHLPEKWDNVLWVITQVTYAQVLTIGENIKTLARAGMSSAVLTPAIIPGGLPTIDGRFELLKAADNTRVFRAVGDNRFRIGFKAMRLEFDKEGNLRRPGGISSDMGKKRPQFRADTDWLNPDHDPEFHMGELFTKQSGRRDSLPILAEGKASSVMD